MENSRILRCSNYWPRLSNLKRESHQTIKPNEERFVQYSQEYFGANNENCMCKPSADAKFIATARKESHPSDTTTASNEVQTSDSMIFSDDHLSDLQERANLIAESNQDRETQVNNFPQTHSPSLTFVHWRQKLRSQRQRRLFQVLNRTPQMLRISLHSITRTF